MHNCTLCCNNPYYLKYTHGKIIKGNYSGVHVECTDHNSLAISPLGANMSSCIVGDFEELGNVSMSQFALLSKL